MKAVIMAGGKGTRLKPLTINTPKPMVPLLDRPVMEYTIDLLKKYGITDIAVTVQFLPEVIKQYFGDGSEFGVNLHYFEEDIPLGTAGSVKNAEEFLDETFVVISGDALTDFNLSKAIAYHKENNAVGTIVLTQVESPLEYGVVMTDESGKIIRFLEKPGWGEVFSDTINTGIYIFEKEIFSYFERAKEFDFSKDLFPLLMAKQRPLYGYTAEGYWSDIGNLVQYRKTQFDMLDGSVQLQIRGTEVLPGIWLGDQVNMDNLVSINSPCFIGNNCVIEDNVNIGGYSIIGEGSLLKSGAALERTVLWKNNFIDQQVELKGATLCRNVSLRFGTVVSEGAVLGDGCMLGQNSMVRPGIKMFPKKIVGNHTIVTQSLIWAETLSNGLFGHSGVKGTCNVDMTTGFVNQLALAYGSTIPVHCTVAIGHDVSPFSYLAAETLTAALHACGIHTVNLGAVNSSVTRYGTYYYGCLGGIQIRRFNDSDDDYVIEFFDQTGVPVSKGAERKIENTFYQEDYRLVTANKLGRRIDNNQASILYKDNLLDLVESKCIRDMHYKVVVEYDYSNHTQMIPEVLEALGCRVIVLNGVTSAPDELVSLVYSYGADLGIKFDANAQISLLATDKGAIVYEDTLYLLQILAQICNEDKNPLYVPVYLPNTVELLAEQYNRTVVRTKVDVHTIMQGCQYKGYHIYYDGLYTLVQMLQLMAAQGKTLSELLGTIPSFILLKKQVDCPWSEKGRVMRFLMEETIGKHIELIDGIKVYHDADWTLILPDCEKPVFQIFSNAKDPHTAEELALMYTNKIMDCRRKITI